MLNDFDFWAYLAEHNYHYLFEVACRFLRAGHKSEARKMLVNIRALRQSYKEQRPILERAKLRSKLACQPIVNIPLWMTPRLYTQGQVDIIVARVMANQQKHWTRRMDDLKFALELLRQDAMEAWHETMVPEAMGPCEFCGGPRISGGEGGCQDDDCEYWDESAAWPATSAREHATDV